MTHLDMQLRFARMIGGPKAEEAYLKKKADREKMLKNWHQFNEDKKDAIEVEVISKQIIK